MKRNSRRNAQDTYGSGLTSGELTIGICVAIFAIAVALGMGIVIGKYDPSLQREAVEESIPKDMPVAATEAPADTGEGVQVSPALPPRAPATPPPPPAATVTPPPAVPDRAPDLPPLPPAGIDPPAPAPDATPQETEPVEAEVVTPKEDPLPVPSDEPAMAAETASPAPAPKEDPPAAPVKEVEVVKPPSEDGGETGSYGVQLAAFSGTDGSKTATEYKNKIRERMKYDARVFPTDDGKLFRVIVVGYGTKAEAAKACTEVRKTAEFEKAFVQVLPK